MDDARRNLINTLIPGMPLPVIWTSEEEMFEVERRLREEAAGRDRPILYPTADPNIIAINLGDPLIKCNVNEYSLLDRLNPQPPPVLSEEDRATLRLANQEYRKYYENKKPPIEDPWTAHLNVKVKVNACRGIHRRSRGRTAPPRPKKSPEEMARFEEAERHALRAKEENSVKYYLMSPEEANARLAEARAKATARAKAAAAAARASSAIARKKLFSRDQELEEATGTKVQVEGRVSILEGPFEDLNLAPAADSSTTASGSEAQVEGGSVPMHAS